MFILGLTGGIAVGKTTATNFFQKKGIEVIDADEISRSLQEKGEQGYLEIIKAFGKTILDKDLNLDRAKLRELAFKDNNKKALEEIMHPLIGQKTLKAFKEVKSKWAIYSAPLWSERNTFDRVLVIDAPRDKQIERVMKRDNSDPKLIEKIISAQISKHERISYCDDLIINDGSIDLFKARLDFYFEMYNKKYEQKN